MEERLTTDQAVAGSSPATDAFAGAKGDWEDHILIYDGVGVQIGH